MKIILNYNRNYIGITGYPSDLLNLINMKIMFNQIKIK